MVDRQSDAREALEAARARAEEVFAAAISSAEAAHLAAMRPQRDAHNARVAASRAIYDSVMQPFNAACELAEREASDERMRALDAAHVAYRTLERSAWAAL